MVTCDRCTEYSVIAGKPSSWDSRNHQAERVVVTGFYPPATMAREIDAAPTAIRAALREAVLCKEVGAFHGGALVCRRAIQLIAREQGAATGNLRDEIDGLTIPEPLKEAAHAIRLVGNEAGHPDAEHWESVASEDLGALLDLTYQIVQYIYEMPRRTAALTKRSR